MNLTAKLVRDLEATLDSSALLTGAGNDKNDVVIVPEDNTRLDTDQAGRADLSSAERESPHQYMLVSSQCAHQGRRSSSCSVEDDCRRSQRQVPDTGRLDCFELVLALIHMAKVRSALTPTSTLRSSQSCTPRVVATSRTAAHSATSTPTRTAWIGAVRWHGAGARDRRAARTATSRAPLRQ
jgi:hypothetical protein